MAIDYRDTISLLQAMERITPPASFLLDTFFPVVPQVAVQTRIAVEYRKRGRHLAPFVTRGGKGINLNLEDSKSDIYIPPMIGPRRILDPDRVNERSFGENIYSTVTPAQRAAEQQAEDLVELQNSIINRKSKMAADLLQTGKCDIYGYADDGQTALLDTVSYDFDHTVVPSTKWDQAGATIFSDIKNASEMVQEDTGLVPTIMVCGKNIADYMLGNDQIMKWLSVPLASNLSLMSIQPSIVSPQVMRVGMIQALNLEIYTYAETYVADDGNVQNFLDPDTAVLAVPGRGRQLHGAVTLVNDAGNGYDTYAAQYVPYYMGSKESQQVALAMYSRCVLAPECVDDWAVIKAK